MDRPRLNNNEDQKGFTLIEILIAIVVFAIGALGVATMQASSIAGNTNGRSITEASVLGTNLYEEIFTYPYNHPLLRDIDGNGDAGLYDGVEGGAGVPDGSMVRGKYTIFWNVAEDNFMRECKTVAVHIQWRERAATRRMTMYHVLPRMH